MTILTTIEAVIKRYFEGEDMEYYVRNFHEINCTRHIIRNRSNGHFVSIVQHHSDNSFNVLDHNDFEIYNGSNILNMLGIVKRTLFT